MPCSLPWMTTCCSAPVATGDVGNVHVGRNTNHTGIFLGKHPKVSRNGRNVGIVLSVFWLAASRFNYLAKMYASNLIFKL